MRLHHQKRLLVVVDALLAVAAIACVPAAVFLPLAGSSQPSSSAREVRVPIAATLPARGSKLHPSVWQKDLRSSLGDVGPRGPAAPPFVLTGTATDPGFTCGFFKTTKGEVKTVKVGEQIEGAEVLSITGSNATVRFEGRVITMTIEGAEGT